MESNPTWITVAAAAIIDQQGRLLLQRRPLHKHHGGSWEFPGGKVESEENPRFALCREVAEELAVTLEPASLAPCGFADQAADGDHPELVLLLYSSRDWNGVPRPLEGQKWGWFDLPAAAELELAPMDRLLLAGFAARE